MIYRIFAVLALTLALFASAPALAFKDAAETTHDGKVVSVAGGKLVMTGKDDKEHSHTLAADAKVTCDAKACKLDDLKIGMKVRVTTKGDDRLIATRVEALDKNEEFEKRNK
jgi:hypothetical protein